MIEDSHVRSWQSILDMLSEVLSIPTALIMILRDKQLEVFVSSKSKGNPYVLGDKEQFDGSGLYCERVIKTKSELLVPNAIEDNEWKDNPDIKLGMISYLGLPLTWPDKQIFGRICVLDKKENSYSPAHRNLLAKLKEHIDLDLKLIKKETETQEKNKQLEAALNEIKTLKSIIPICSYCHNIRNEKGTWDKLEDYLYKKSNIYSSHTICPECEPKARAEAGFDD